MRMSGHVDEWRRPLLKIGLSDGNPILTLIDIGFDGYLAFSEPNAIVCGVDFEPMFERDVFLYQSHLNSDFFDPGIAAQRRDASGFSDELVPGVAGGVGYGVLIGVQPVREMARLHMQPHAFHGVQLGRIGR